MTGKVYLVGAGPGDPGLMTVKGLELVRRADVIAFDRLIPAGVLDEARIDAERVDVGKLPQKHRLSQDEINALLIDRARQGKTVVRLKGGDPFVFGRGGEEALACIAAGVPFEVVPGVSSAIAVPAYAGVPVTQRGVVRAFTVATGHDNPNQPEGEGLDYEALAAAGRLGTLVLLMGVFHLGAIADKLIEHGIAADTPALCVEWGTTPSQRTAEGTLSDIAARVAEAGLKAPALTVIGEVVRLRGQGLDWFHP
jgi:uroporphyrinogen III methyltransferase/synthase